MVSQLADKLVALDQAGPEGPAPRKLAAILAADVAGYSRLIGLDEEGTLEAESTLTHLPCEIAASSTSGGPQIALMQSDLHASAEPFDDPAWLFELQAQRRVFRQGIGIKPHFQHTLQYFCPICRCSGMCETSLGRGHCSGHGWIRVGAEEAIIPWRLLARSRDIRT
jgi:hypothetical protein